MFVNILWMRAVTPKQNIGCFVENPNCDPKKEKCRLKNYVKGMETLKDEVEDCASACRLGNSVYFAKTVRIS